MSPGQAGDSDLRPNNVDLGQAQAIVKELYTRYKRQLDRWKDYRSLFLFLAFVAVFLGEQLVSQRLLLHNAMFKLLNVAVQSWAYHP